MASIKKSKLPTQPKRLDEAEKAVDLTIETILDAEEYKPADSKEKYSHIKTPEYLYKIIASRGDYVKLQEEVTSHLNDGWSLAGGLAVAVQTDHYSASTVFTQAVFKTK